MQESLQQLDIARTALLTAVAACRDKNHTAYEKRKALAECRCDASALKRQCFEYKCPAPDCRCRCKIGCCCCKCGREEKEWRIAQAEANNCRDTISRPADKLVSQCREFDSQARDRMEFMRKCGSMPVEEATTFFDSDSNCSKFKDEAKERADECYVPGTGAKCVPP